jgi:transcriptional regulator with XRE-family HTH domain
MMLTLPTINQRTKLVDMLTADQLRAARAILKWRRADLAKASGVPAVTIQSFEGGADSKISTVSKLRAACERAGIVFIDAGDGLGPGLRLRQASGKSKR